MTAILTKRPAELRQATFDFSNLPDLSGTSLASATASFVGSDSAITLGGSLAGTLPFGAPTVNGSQALIYIKGGTDGLVYTIFMTGTTALGVLVEGVGNLFVTNG